MSEKKAGLVCGLLLFSLLCNLSQCRSYLELGAEYNRLERDVMIYQQEQAKKKLVETKVYVMPNGKKYHRISCFYIDNGFITLDLSAAKARGYTPCSRCDPPG